MTERELTEVIVDLQLLSTELCCHGYVFDDCLSEHEECYETGLYTPGWSGGPVVSQKTSNYVEFSRSTGTTLSLTFCSGFLCRWGNLTEIPACRREPVRAHSNLLNGSMAKPIAFSTSKLCCYFPVCCVMPKASCEANSTVITESTV
eukprot:4881523-Amphidinium_carterae.1